MRRSNHYVIYQLFCKIRYARKYLIEATQKSPLWFRNKTSKSMWIYYTAKQTLISSITPLIFGISWLRKTGWAQSILIAL